MSASFFFARWIFASNKYFSERNIHTIPINNETKMHQTHNQLGEMQQTQMKLKETWCTMTNVDGIGRATTSMHGTWRDAMRLCNTWKLHHNMHYMYFIIYFHWAFHFSSHGGFLLRTDVLMKKIATQLFVHKTNINATNADGTRRDATRADATGICATRLYNTWKMHHNKNFYIYVQLNTSFFFVGWIFISNQCFKKKSQHTFYIQKPWRNEIGRDAMRLYNTWKMHHI